MFFYSYLFRSNKHFRIFRTVLQVLLSYINTYAGITSLLHNSFRDHSRQKINTSIKKRLLHQQHHISSLQQHALKAPPRRSLYHLQCLPMPQRSCLSTPTKHPHCLLSYLLAPPAKIDMEFTCCVCAHAAV